MQILELKFNAIYVNIILVLFGYECLPRLLIFCESYSVYILFSLQTPLHLAVLTGNAEITSMLISFGAQPSVKDSNGNTALHLAVLHGNLDCVKAILNINNTKSLPLDVFNDEGKGMKVSYELLKSVYWSVLTEGKCRDVFLFLLITKM
jgi:hypothetical protein